MVRHGTRTGIAARLRVWCLWVRLPLVPLISETSRGPTARSPAHIRGTMVRLHPGRLPRAHGLWGGSWSAGVWDAYLSGAEGDRVRVSGRPLVLDSMGGWSN